MRSLAKSMCQEWDLKHPPSLNPEDLLHFVYLDEFIEDWKDAYPNDQDEIDLWGLEILIMTSPEQAPVVPGSGGLRKVRFGQTGVGKRGGIRVCYAYFPEHHIVLMIMAYRKNQRESLSDGELQSIKRLLDYTSHWLDSHA